MFLSVVGRQYRNLLCRVPNQSHIHKSGHDKFGLGQILVKERTWRGFSNPIEIIDVDQLEIVAESSIGFHVLFAVENVTQIAKAFVTPIVKAAKAGTSTALGVQVHSWYT